MADYYLVENTGGPMWDSASTRRNQEGWDAHAAFMDSLVDDGFIVAGGPVGAPEGNTSLLVVKARDEGEVRARLAADPWAGGVLRIRDVRPWTIWLGRVSSE